jgi:hypothetical protein
MNRFADHVFAVAAATFSADVCSLPMVGTSRDDRHSEK